MQLTSPAFSNGQSIPQKYTCDGEGISPPLQWRDAPENAQSLALAVEDPDAPAGTFIHWLVFNLPVDLTGLPEDVAHNELVAQNARLGKNSAAHVGYTPPCPPDGTHRYYFRLFALAVRLPISNEMTIDQLHKALRGHVLEQAELMGTYGRG